jgi:hypothetical protein|tara:strand:+ start:644 stop:772 length:129 start_codon:yes stop_codon:yes gene_type:complete
LFDFESLGIVGRFTEKARNAIFLSYISYDGNLVISAMTSNGL